MRVLFGLVVFLFIPHEMIEAKEIRIVPKTKEWSAKQIETIREAAKIVDKRLGSHRIKSCTYRNAWRGLPDYDGWARAMGVWRRQKTLEIAVDAQEFKRKYFAKAFVGKGQIDEKNDRWTHLEINFNREVLDRKALQDIKNRDLWVKVIAHEIGHNLGLSHGADPRASKEDNYAGYFVTELGYCVASYGRTGSDRGDRKLRRERYQKYGVKK